MLHSILFPEATHSDIVKNSFPNPVTMISDINLNYLGGPNVITRFLNVEKGSRTGNKSETRTLHWAWLTFKIEDRGHEPRNVRFLKARKVKETNVPLHSSERRLEINK